MYIYVPCGTGGTYRDCALARHRLDDKHPKEIHSRALLSANHKRLRNELYEFRKRVAGSDRIGVKSKVSLCSKAFGGYSTHPGQVTSGECGSEYYKHC